ncbi:cycloheximide resistance protein [Meredithblackwellia eburnea MCA 4105]
MSALFRETAAGQFVRLISRGTLLKYPEEEPNFVVPEKFTVGYKTPPDDTQTLVSSDLEAGSKEGKAQATSAAPEPKPDHSIVGWYGDDDPDNPQNWSSLKKGITTAIICLLTFSVYVGSSLITSGFPSLIEEFGIGLEETTVTLSIYVFSYGFGALIFSPLSEIPAFGRNPFYWGPMILMCAFQAGAATTPTFAGLVLLRAITAFCGAPVLSTGGGTLADIYQPVQLPVMFSIWVLPAFSAPAIGPVFGNFAAQANGWRWTMWELLWLIGFVTIFLFFLLPETSHGNILLRRAQRLRALTGNPNLKSQSEVDQGQRTFSSILTEAILRPFNITVLDPSIAFSNLYIGCVYFTYYLFFVCYPTVYADMYHFSYGAQGLAYLNIAIGGAIGFAIYVGYQLWYINPYYIRKGWPVNEKRLEPAVISSIFAPIGLFIFAWTSRSDIPWIASQIGSATFVAANFITLQCVFLYIVLSYPQYSASILASNDFIRSALAAGFLHAGDPMFKRMGVNGGVSFLAGLTILGVVGIYLMYHFGARLRAKSRFAVGDQQ